MTGRAGLHATPHPGRVLREQIRRVGGALRVPALVAGGLLGISTLLLALPLLDRGSAIDFHPEYWTLPGILGALLPLLVWSEDRRSRAFLWTLPVDHRRHSLMKVLAGWVWLQGTIGFLVLWLAGLVLLTGGDLLAQEVVRLGGGAAAAAPGEATITRWGPEPLFWLVPFSGATVTYLISSAVVLGVGHPLRWIAGGVGVAALLVTTGEVLDSELLISATSGVWELLYYGPYGLDAALTARTEYLRNTVLLPSGETAVVWRARPDRSHWATATFLWLSLGMAALWISVPRQGGRRTR